MRLFFALDIPESDKNWLENWRAQHLGKAFKSVAKENFHITLSFLGTISCNQRDQMVKFTDQLWQNLPPIKNSSLQFNHLGLFKKPKVLYLGLTQTPEWLDNLANAMKDQAVSLNIFQEYRDYCPHLTLCRKANTLPKHTPLNYTVDIPSFSLYHSQSTSTGVQYQPIQRWPLKK